MIEDELSAGYVEETANNVHVVVSSRASGGDTGEEANNGLLTRQVVAGIGMISDASCFAIGVYLELLVLVM